MARTTRTLNPLHFEDLEPHRFEDLVRQLAYGYKQWRSLEATGRLGSDEGIDIRGVEVVPLNPEFLDNNDQEEEILVEDRLWVFQCKRYQRIYPKMMRQIVAEAVPDEDNPPYGLVVVAACDVSKAALDALRMEARSRNVQEFEFWGKARVEDMLFQPRFDHLLFAYFGVSLTTRRRSRLTAIRRELSIKRKLLRTLTNDNDIRDDIPWKTVLVRDVDNEHYPFEDEIPGFKDFRVPPWHLAQARFFTVNGLFVTSTGYVGWIQEDGKWDVADFGPNNLLNALNSHMPPNRDSEARQDDWQQLQALEQQVPEEQRASVELLKFIPYENVLEVDADGDPLHNIPHLYCTFYGVNGPYRGKELYVYRLKERWKGIMELDPALRETLFKQIQSRADRNRTNTARDSGENEDERGC